MANKQGIDNQCPPMPPLNLSADEYILLLDMWQVFYHKLWTIFSIYWQERLSKHLYLV